MPLILTAPAASGIRTYRNGVKVIRLHEWLGPARGTLSTESDPWSVCGTVVRDTQTVSYSGTDPNQTIIDNLATSGLDTIRIHMDDLNITDYFDYSFYLGARAEGEVDLTKQNSQHTFLTVGSNAACVRAYTRNAAFSGPPFQQAITAWGPKELTNPHYKIINMGGSMFWGSFTEGQEWLVLRAATGTGGSFEWLLDVLYLVPIRDADDPYVATDFRILPHFVDPLGTQPGGPFTEANDDSPLSWAGHYSVMPNAPTGSIGGAVRIADHQEGEDEITMPDTPSSFSASQWLLDPSSDLVIPVGSFYVPTHTVDTDSFNRTTNAALHSYLGESDENRAWDIVNDFPMQAASGYHWCDGSELEMHSAKFDHISGPAMTFFFPVTSSSPDPGASCVVSLGATSIENGTDSTTVGHENLNGMNHAIMTIKVRTDHILVAGFQMFAGFLNTSGQGTVASVSLESQGDFGARVSAPVAGQLLFYPHLGCDRGTTPDGDFITQEVLDEVDMGTYEPNDWMWIKIEMRWHVFKAKFWFDGDSEPSEWQVEGISPSGYLSTSSPWTNYVYPWNDDPAFGFSQRDGSNLLPMLGVRYFRPIENTIGEDMQFTSHPVRTTSTFWDDLTIEYESYGDDPTDVHLHIKKYDNTIDHGQVTVPWEAQRMVIAPTQRLTHNEDENQFNWTLWKEEGAPETQAAVIGEIIQKLIYGGPIHLESIAFRPYQEEPEEEE